MTKAAAVKAMTANEPDSLLSVLGAWRGIIYLLGGGDTEAFLYHLAMLHPGLVGITSTIPIPSFPNRISAYQVITEERLLPTLVGFAAETHRLVAYAQPSIRKGYLAGVSPSLIGVAHRQGGFDVTLVKADGTECPPSHWPRASSIILTEAATVIPMISASALSQSLPKKIAHRRVTGIKDSHALKPMPLAGLVASPTGGLKGIGKAKVIPVINMADEPTWEKQGIIVAETALRLTEHFDRVVLTCMSRTNPLVRVIHRSALQS